MNPSTVRSARLYCFFRRPARPFPLVRNGFWFWFSRRQRLAFGLGRRRQ